MTDTYSERRLPVLPVRLRTLLLIRWIAAAGQLATVLQSSVRPWLRIPLTYCLSAITVLVISNLVMTAMRSGSARLGDGQALTLLVFDAAPVIQFVVFDRRSRQSLRHFDPCAGLGFCNDPVAQRRATITLTALAVLSITVLAYFHFPLPWSRTGLYCTLPYVLGIWTALAVATVFISAYVWAVADEARHMSEAAFGDASCVGSRARPCGARWTGSGGGA